MTEEKRLPKVPKEHKLRMIQSVQELTEEEIVRFLDERGAKSECLSCGDNSWRVFRPQVEGLATLGLHVMSEEAAREGNQEQSFPLIILACNRCGFVRTHSALMMGNWRLGQENKE